MMDDSTCGACSTHEKEETLIYFDRKKLKGRDRQGDLGVNEWIIFK
jgi:hypothetical protein